MRKALLDHTAGDSETFLDVAEYVRLSERFIVLGVN